MKKNLHFYLFLLCPAAYLSAQPVAAAAEVVNYIAWTQTPPALSNVDVMHTVRYEYTIPQTRIVMTAIVKCSSDGSTIGPIAQAIINPTPATTETPVAVSGNLYVPPGTMPSAQLPDGQFYRWEASIRGNGNVLILGISSPLTINGPLGTDSFAAKKMALYPNPVADRLFLPENLLNRNISISDSSGRIVFSGMHSGSFEVAGFSPGLYFLTAESGETGKFVKR
ncbi:hypothetical protein FNO01nite_04800 [Flavobacterium noncentrifugens]|uniref:Por secretion system C-terminal sorting domain-containing protein n=1 Tax=Flavobacterium noncentrifugens TaxID=1128970 RepID=A0A1G8SF25_9FLAO|nr:T9SS type A sorting domain-containing protein [Flavobacterium noncentrifugens]GEP49808.1 hypothetical protein FNO01nite_04800 [Flavobacterium noncentrifugens]SDJ27852.1 Por secretion system C-terminal sorting domain-containing protein [Flavobacterium noncentrifugens]